MKFKFFSLLLVLSATLRGGVYEISISNLSSRGWYDSTGAHSDSLGNYLVGTPGAASYRNFFIFDLADLPSTEAITSATLSLYNPPAGAFTGFQSVNPSEVYQLFAVETTMAASLRAGGSGLVSIFNDLGGGVAYSSGKTVSTADDGTNILINLNSAFLNYAQASVGSEVMIGGALTSNEGTGSRALFLGTHNMPLGNTRLIITTSAIPEPSACVGLFGLVALSLAIYRKEHSRVRRGK